MTFFFFFKCLGLVGVTMYFANEKFVATHLRGRTCPLHFVSERFMTTQPTYEDAAPPSFISFIPEKRTYLETFFFMYLLKRMNNKIKPANYINHTTQQAKQCHKPCNLILQTLKCTFEKLLSQIIHSTTPHSENCAV